MLEQILHERIIAQDLDVESVADAIRCSKAGISDPNRLIASFMFMGQPSVVSQLVGASPGYVGYGDGGKLTEVVRRRPYSVVQFDEIEKPHLDVFSILLQLLDDGRITNSHGSLHILETIRNNEDIKEAFYEMMKQQVVELARKTFRPKFMNRIDEYIVSQPLNSSEISKIVELQVVQMRQVKKRLEQNKINLEYTKEAVDLLAQLGFDPNNGARPVKQMIEKLVKKEITLKVLKGDFAEDGTILIDADQPNNKLTDAKHEALETYGSDLTKMARQGKLPPLIGRDDEVNRCIQILCRMTESNPVIIGEPGVGKTAIVEG
uniref:HSP100/ClpB, putative n=1 Tax=Arabidopsis thaliana TaxID=3702 RepID=Q9SK30_ARATH|nr:HSP100/ClpB, putative [Arabidopsis thaliana]